MDPFDQVAPRLRQLFGLAPGDISRDTELAIYFDTALAAARTYTNRWLAPVAQFTDVFQALGGACCPCSSCEAILAEVPIVSIDAVVSDGAAGDPLGYLAAPDGTLYQRGGPGVIDLRFQTLNVTYTAGYDPLPADLAEALCQIAASAAPSSSGASVGGGAVNKLTVFDVGSVEFSGTPSGFFGGGIKSFDDALLGPWQSTLDSYRDLAKSLGGAPNCLHVSELVPVP